MNPVIIWGGIHPQTRPEDCLEHCDLVARGEGEHVLAELTDRIGLDREWTDIARDFSPGSASVVHPNFDNSPFSTPTSTLQGVA